MGAGAGMAGAGSAGRGDRAAAGGEPVHGAAPPGPGARAGPAVARRAGTVAGTRAGTGYGGKSASAARRWSACCFHLLSAEH